MTAFLIANMAPIIFASLVFFLLLGFPVAFSLAANGIIFGWIGIELGLFHPTFFQALPERIFGGDDRRPPEVRTGRNKNPPARTAP